MWRRKRKRKKGRRTRKRSWRKMSKSRIGSFIEIHPPSGGPGEAVKTDIHAAYVQIFFFPSFFS